MKNRRIFHGDRESGGILLLTLLILSAVSILAASIAFVTMNDRNLSKYERHSVEALAAAETGLAFAKRSIRDLVAPMEDADNDGRPDFALNDTLSWGGSYEVVCEASDIKGLGITAYQSNGFTIIAEGRFRGATRRVKAEIVHDSFLKYARFTAMSDLSYACDAHITGEVFVNGDLLVPCNCAHGRQCRFLEMVSVTDDIPNAACADFFRGYVTDAEPIDLQNSFAWADVRAKARGLGADNACEKHGNIGIYISLPGTDPLALAGQANPNTNVLVFERFDFCNTALASPDTVVTYGGNAVINPQTGQVMRTHDFNGIIFFENSATVRGTLDGVSAHSITLYATNDIYCRNNIVTGHKGFDPITRLPDNTGDPINLGLVAEDYIYMHTNCPRVMRVDAMILSRTSNWSGQGNEADHPMAALGALDLDLDGLVGETPVNDDPTDGEGWDEIIADATDQQNTWVLNISGGIITMGTGNAAPWNNSNVLNNASGPTRRYNYDMDLTSFPPPCFPVPLNLYKDVSWSELLDARGSLAAQLPD
jgi:hypothetical protein